MDELLSLIKEFENDGVGDILISNNRFVTEQPIKSIEYFCDFVFCIDITGAMDPLLRNIKEVIANLHNRLKNYCSEYPNRKLISLRVRIIAFRDVYYDGKYWLESSDFFILPSQTNELLAVLSTLEAKGGGDDPESALEALALAMKSDWIKVLEPQWQRARHVIILCTDDAAHKFEEAEDYTSTNYPEGMPKSYKELLMAWHGQGDINLSMDKRAKRLVVFAPEGYYPWDNICEDFERYMCFPVKKGLGFSDINTEIMLETIFCGMTAC